MIISNRIFTRNEKQRAQGMRCQELRNERWKRDDDDNKQPPVQNVCRPKVKSQVHRSEAEVNMVVILPWEFRIATCNTDFEDETSAQLILDP
jgi:hypothetical protein